MDLIVSNVEIAVSLDDTRVALRGFLVEPELGTFFEVMDVRVEIELSKDSVAEQAEEGKACAVSCT